MKPLARLPSAVPFAAPICEWRVSGNQPTPPLLVRLEAADKLVIS